MAEFTIEDDSNNSNNNEMDNYAKSAIDELVNLAKQDSQKLQTALEENMKYAKQYYETKSMHTPRRRKPKDYIQNDEQEEEIKEYMKDRNRNSKETNPNNPNSKDNNPNDADSRDKKDIDRKNNNLNHQIDVTADLADEFLGLGKIIRQLKKGLIGLGGVLASIQLFKFWDKFATDINKNTTSSLLYGFSPNAKRSFDAVANILTGETNEEYFNEIAKNVSYDSSIGIDGRRIFKNDSEAIFFNRLGIDKAQLLSIAPQDRNLKIVEILQNMGKKDPVGFSRLKGLSQDAGYGKTFDLVTAGLIKDVDVSSLIQDFLKKYHIAPDLLKNTAKAQIQTQTAKSMFSNVFSDATNVFNKAWANGLAIVNTKMPKTPVQQLEILEKANPILDIKNNEIDNKELLRILNHANNSLYKEVFSNLRFITEKDKNTAIMRILKNSMNTAKDIKLVSKFANMIVDYGKLLSKVKGDDYAESILQDIFKEDKEISLPSNKDKSTIGEKALRWEIIEDFQRFNQIPNENILQLNGANQGYNDVNGAYQSKDLVNNDITINIIQNKDKINSEVIGNVNNVTINNK